MRAGRLRRQITIEVGTATQDATGQEILSWATFATVRASVEPLNGKESFTAEQEQAKATTRFRVRYIEGVTPKMRVNYDGRLFNIVSVLDPHDRRRELHILGVEDVS